MDRSWLWPLPGHRVQIPSGDGDGAFGKRRRFDMHTGVDLYCRVGQPVVAVEAGVVVGVEVFTGPLNEAGSPWWRTTYAVLVEGASGVVLYGEVHPNVHAPRPGQRGQTVEAGDVIGYVLRVRKYKLKNVFNWKPHTMLHLERYTPGTTKAVWWHHDQPKPENLLDPTPRLNEASISGVSIVVPR